MSRAGVVLKQWGPALLMMLVIFGFSSRPAADLPDFGSWDFAIKKGAHAVGYGLLALLYLKGLGIQGRRYWLAWALTILYSITDEYHQSMVPGRHPSVHDSGIDSLGSAVALGLRALSMKWDGPRGGGTARQQG